MEESSVSRNRGREHLDELRAQKEHWFAKKEELKKQIAALIARVREVKATHETSMRAIKELKEKREAQNAIVKKLVAEIKTLSPALSKERKNPEMIRRQIEQREKRIETGAVAFDEEQRLMKWIKALKKEYEEAKSADTAWKEARDLSKKINEEKKKAEEFHLALVAAADENREAFKKFKQLSKEINEVKKEEEDTFAKFIAFKQKYAEANKLYLEEIQNVRAAQDAQRDREKKQRQEQQHQILERKRSTVEEKLKTGKGKKILTTEDLIAFQGRPEN